MVNFLFLVDTSYVMNQKVPEYGCLSMLDLCKTAIHRSVNNRRKSMPKPPDGTHKQSKYLLVTHSATNPVQCGWENAPDFLKAVEAMQAHDAPNFGGALSTAFRLLQSNPNQITSYGQGWRAWQREMNVIIILSYCIDTYPISQDNGDGDGKSAKESRNRILNLSPRTLMGEELESDWIQWNYRIFTGNLHLFGTLHVDHAASKHGASKSVRECLNELCLQTAPSDSQNHVINNELHSMGQMERWISHIMRDNSRDGIMVEFWDSTKEEKAKDGDPAVVKFNEGQLFRELLIPTPQCPGKWPIPEGYSPKERAERSKSKGHHHGESKHDLPARPCRPQITLLRAVKNAPCLPRSEWKVPYEQYEITSPRLREFVLNLPQNISYYCYVHHSAGAKFNYAKPWGALKGDSKRKAFLYVFAYDFPFVWNQIDVFLGGSKRGFTNFNANEWRKAVGAYLNFVPSYYVPSLQDLLVQTTNRNHLPAFPSSALEPSTMSYLNEVQRYWRGNAEFKVKPIGIPLHLGDADGDVLMDGSHGNHGYSGRHGRESRDHRDYRNGRRPVHSDRSKVNDHGMEDSDEEEENDAIYSDEFGLDTFPQSANPKGDEVAGGEEDDILKNAMHSNQGLKGMKETKEWIGMKQMKLSLFGGVRDQGTKRKWSTMKRKVESQRESKDVITRQRRKRRRVFAEKMDNAVCRVQGEWQRTVSDLKNGDDIGALLGTLRVSVFGHKTGSNAERTRKLGTARIRSDDSFAMAVEQEQQKCEENLDEIDIVKLDRESQHKLLCKFSVRGPEEMTLANCGNDISPLRAFQSSFTRNRVSVYGHNNASSWKMPYRLIEDQQERDGRHVEKHSVMGNYGLFTEKMRLFKKDEFRNPVPDEHEYSNYGLALSFMFLQEKISEYAPTTGRRRQSFLETESRLKSDKLPSFGEVMAMKAQMATAMWTKNDISTTFNCDNTANANDDADALIRGQQQYVGDHQRSLLKSADWLSSQVLHGLKPANLGGNPFKKRRRKSPFPLVSKPRDFKPPKVGVLNREKRNAVTQAQLMLQKKQQDQFEQEMMAMPILSAMMANNEKTEDEDDRKPPPPPPKTAKAKTATNESVDEKVSAAAGSSETTDSVDGGGDAESVCAANVEIVQSDTKMESVAESTTTTTALAATTTTKKVVGGAATAVPMRVSAPKTDPTPRRKEQVKSAIERAKRQQMSKKRQVQLLPMKRRPHHLLPSGSNGASSSSPSPSPTSTTITEPSAKRTKLSNGVSHDAVKEASEPRESVQNGGHEMNGSIGSRTTQNVPKSPRAFSSFRTSAAPPSSNETNRNLGHSSNGRRRPFEDENGIRRISVSDQVDNVLSFLSAFRRMVRSQGKLDAQWLEHGLHCMKGLDAETRSMVYQTLMHEAKTYNRFKLSLNIQRHFVSLN